jgi:prepilin-type N-terminal cleavage/methylation domain-containing protein
MDILYSRFFAPVPFSTRQTASAGFTLLELMVVVFVMGVLAAIAIPSFSNQARRAKEAEAKMIVSHINRAQQLYFVEHSQFGLLEDLELNLSPSPHYTYYSVPEAIDPPAALTTAAPEDPSLRGFAGKVWLAAQIEPSLEQQVSRSILCEGEMGKVPDVDEASCTP